MAVKLNTTDCVELFEQLSGSMIGDDQGWLKSHRAEAMASFCERGLPTLRHEDWKYTDIRPLTKREYTVSLAGAVEGDVVPLPSPEGLNACRLVFVNGQLHSGLSDLDSVPEGVEFGSLAEYVTSHSSVVEQWLGKALPADGHGFSSLNDAFVNDGAFIRVMPNTVSDRVLEILFTVSSGETAPLVQPRNLIVIEEGAQVHIVERYSGDDDAPYLNNTLTEVFVEPEGVVEFSRIQEEGRRSGHIGGLFVRQRRNSRSVINTVSLDGLLIRNDARIYLDEPGAECRLNGLALGSGRQHIDNHTEIDHNAACCVSREFYKSVLDDRSRSVFHGRIVVQKDAQKTDSEQQNQNLLLSRDAEIDTKPQLEIYADDVKCSHGATVGQLDEDSVFYLRSRGIDEASARKLLTIAFADAAISGISNDALRGYIDLKIRENLEKNT